MISSADRDRGGGNAREPLPHHRTYGSVSGGSERIQASRGKPRETEVVEVAVWQSGEELTAVRAVPPLARVERDVGGGMFAQAAGAHHPVDLPGMPPLLELQCPQSATHPAVEPREGPRSFGQAIVGLPPDQVAPEVSDDLLDASPAGPSREVSDPPLHLAKGLLRDAQPDGSSTREEAEAEEFPQPRPRDRTLRLVDPQPELGVEPPQRLEDAFARSPGPHVHVAVVGVARE